MKGKRLLRVEFFGNLMVIFTLLLFLSCGGGEDDTVVQTGLAEDTTKARVVVEPAGGEESWGVVSCTIPDSGDTVNAITADLLMLGGQDDVELELLEQSDSIKEYRWQGYLILLDDPATEIDIYISQEDGSEIIIKAPVELKTASETDTTMVVLSATDLAGPNGAIIYWGQSYTDTVTVPEDSLVGVWKDEKAYLYHPALGDVELSEETSQLAMAYFHYDHQEDTSPASSSDTLYTSRAMEFGDEVVLTTGVGIKITGKDNAKGTLTFTAYNHTKVWTAVKTSNSEKPVFLPPKNAYIETNFLRYLKRWSAENEKGKISLASSRTHIKVEIGRPIETFRAFSGLQLEPAEYKEKVDTAKKHDLKICNALNAIDTTYWWSETGKVVVGMNPFECVDIVTGFLANSYLIYELSNKAGQQEVLEAFTTLVQDSFQSAISCAVKVLPAMAGHLWFSAIMETLFTSLDVLSAASFGVERGVEKDLNNWVFKWYDLYSFMVPTVGGNTSKYVGHWRVVEEFTTSNLWVADCNVMQSGALDCQEYLWGAEHGDRKTGMWSFDPDSQYFVVRFLNHLDAVCAGRVEWEKDTFGREAGFWVDGVWGVNVENRLAWLKQADDCECTGPTCPERCPEFPTD